LFLYEANRHPLVVDINMMVMVCTAAPAAVVCHLFIIFSFFLVFYCIDRYPKANGNVWCANAAAAAVVIII